MRTVVIALMAAVCVVAPRAHSQTQDPDLEIRAALAERLIDATVRDGLDKMMADIVERQIAASPNMTEEQRAWSTATVPEIMQRHLSVMIDEMEHRYTATFTTAELRALVGFYDTPEGRGIAAKQQDIGARQGEGLMTFMQGFITDYRDKYCAAFTCPAATTAREMSKGAD